MTLKLEKDKTIIAQKWPDAISTSTPVTRIALLTTSPPLRPIQSEFVEEGVTIMVTDN